MISSVWLAVVGCGNSSTLPGSVQVSLPDSSTQTAMLGSGVQSLANTEWSVFRAADNRFMAKITFDENGAMSALMDNQVLGKEVFGSSIIADGQVQSTAIDGLSYTAGSFGSENDSGFAFEMRAVAFFSGIEVGNGSAKASGTHDADTMEGTFSFKFTLSSLAASLVTIPEGTKTEDTFEFKAFLVTDGK